MTALNTTAAALIAGVLCGCGVDVGDLDAPEPDLRTMAVGEETLRYEIVGSLAMYQGDIILGHAPDPPPRKIEHWPEGTIPYVISDEYAPAEREIVAREVDLATAQYRDRTGVELVARADQPDYVVIRPHPPGGGCGASALGRVGGPQPLYFEAYCGFGSLLHQLGHALGAVHEETRRDRDNFVILRMENVAPGREHLFDLAPQCFDDNGAYDYWSIMHGWAGEASIAPCDEEDDRGCTLVSRQGIDHYEMGQRNGLSRGDVDGLCGLYDDPTELSARTLADSPVHIALELEWRWVPTTGAVRIVSNRQGVLSERFPLPNGSGVFVYRLERGRHVLTIETLERCHSRFEYVVEVP